MNHQDPVELIYKNMRFLITHNQNYANLNNCIEELKKYHKNKSMCCCSVTQSSLTLCNPMDCSTPGFPVHHQFPEFTQTQVHWVGDAIQPSHPLSSPSPPAFNLSQHQSPSLSHGGFSNSFPLSQWCHPAISSSVAPFSSCPQSFPASGSFPMSQLFALGGQNIGASASVLSVNIQGWFPLGLTGSISLLSKGL